MWTSLRKPISQFCGPLKRHGHGYGGGCPGAVILPTRPGFSNLRASIIFYRTCPLAWIAQCALQYAISLRESSDLELRSWWFAIRCCVMSPMNR